MKQNSVHVCFLSTSFTNTHYFFSKHGNPNSDPHACITTILVTKPSPQPLHPVIFTLLHDHCHNVCQECQNLSTGISHLFPNHSPGEQITVHINLVLCYVAHLYTAQKGVSDPLRLEQQAVISHPICPPNTLKSLQLSQPFDYKYSPSLATTQLPAGSIFLLLAQGRPPPILQGLHYAQS